MLALIITAILVAIVVVVVITARQGNHTLTSRSIAIEATPDKIFPHINNVQQFNEWNPWAKLDADTKTAFEGPVEGVGSRMSWVSRKIGSGSMTNVLSQPPTRIKYAMDFTAPFQSQAVAEFTLNKSGTNQTEVTWFMYGERGFLQKLMGLFINCDKMVGEQFEKGLHSLKGIAEATNQAD